MNKEKKKWKLKQKVTYIFTFFFLLIFFFFEKMYIYYCKQKKKQQKKRNLQKCIYSFQNIVIF
jgi:preprotein translocase subunit SecY